MTTEAVTITMPRISAEQTREILSYQLGCHQDLKPPEDDCVCWVCKAEREALVAIVEALGGPV